MKKLVKLISLFTFFMLAISLTSCKSKTSDADLKAKVETALKDDPMAANTMVSVNDGVVTLTGECKDDMCKAHCEDEAAKVDGVKSVVNNLTVAPPVVNAGNMELENGLRDALKDVPDVQGSVNDGTIVLTGEIEKDKWMMVKQTLDKMTPKGYDLTGLTIK